VVAVYEILYPLYRKLYFALGSFAGGEFGEILPKLIEVAAQAVKRESN
jgi:hypothetical protein